MERIYLEGSEDVRRASQNMCSASSEMLTASNNISNALYEHQQFLNEWLDKFENILKENIK